MPPTLASAISSDSKPMTCQVCRWATTEATWSFQVRRAAMAVVRRASRDRGKSRAKPSKKVKSADDFMTSRRWYKIFVDAVEAAGIEWEGKAYTTRAAAATWMFKAGAALPDVQEALNHSNPATTLIYLRAAKAEEDETVNSALDSIV